MTAHKHATLMLQYAHDAATTDKPWEWWEAKLPGYRGFMPLVSHPMWVEAGEYRRVGKVITKGDENETV